MSKEQAAWAAGLFEGEGSIVPTHEASVRLTLQMQDPGPVQMLHRFFPEANYREYTPPGGKKQYIWDLCGWKKAEAVMEVLLPWLCDRRRERWREVLETKPAPKAYPPDCGSSVPRSSAGYQRHRARGEEPCGACIQARRDYENLRLTRRA